MILLAFSLLRTSVFPIDKQINKDQIVLFPYWRPKHTRRKKILTGHKTMASKSVERVRKREKLKSSPKLVK